MSRCYVNTSGIYCIRNLISDRIYVGSAKCLNMRFRFHRSDLRANEHHNIKLQRAWNKYGQENFRFEILEECSLKKLIEREQYYIDNLKPFYNICKIAWSTLGFKHSLKMRQDLSKKKKGVPNFKLRGRKMSQETKRKLSLARMGYPSSRKGVKCSKETCEKMRLANIGKKYPKEVNMKKGRKGVLNYWYGTGKRIIQFTLDEKEVDRFTSSNDVFRKLGFNNNNILKCCKKKIPNAYGYKWKFEDEN